MRCGPFEQSWIRTKINYHHSIIKKPGSQPLILFWFIPSSGTASKRLTHLLSWKNFDKKIFNVLLTYALLGRRPVPHRKGWRWRILTFSCENMASTVRGSVGEIKAPKYRVSRKVKLEARDAGINWTQPYIREPMTRAERAVPTSANVRMAPRLRKKYFWKKIY